MTSIKDPRTFTESDMPFHFVLSNQATDLVSFLIDWRTKSNYDHCMQAINPGKFITQDFGGYHEIPMDKYLKQGGQLKFIKITNATETFNIAFRSAILNRLAQPWYKKIYDFGNIIGRAIGLPWIRLPGTYDCSEISLFTVKQLTQYLKPIDAGCIALIPNNASPDDIDMAVKNNPTIFTVVGVWAGDEGVVL
jgi:hypothetical protein